MFSLDDIKCFKNSRNKFFTNKNSELMTYINFIVSFETPLSKESCLQLNNLFSKTENLFLKLKMQNNKQEYFFDEQPFSVFSESKRYFLKDVRTNHFLENIDEEFYHHFFFKNPEQYFFQAKAIDGKLFISTSIDNNIISLNIPRILSYLDQFISLYLLKDTNFMSYVDHPLDEKNSYKIIYQLVSDFWAIDKIGFSIQQASLNINTHQTSDFWLELNNNDLLNQIFLSLEKTPTHVINNLREVFSHENLKKINIKKVNLVDKILDSFEATMDNHIHLNHFNEQKYRETMLKLKIFCGDNKSLTSPNKVKIKI